MLPGVNCTDDNLPGILWAYAVNISDLSRIYVLQSNIAINPDDIDDSQDATVVEYDNIELVAGAEFKKINFNREESFFEPGLMEGGNGYYNSRLTLDFEGLSSEKASAVNNLQGYTFWVIKDTNKRIWTLGNVDDGVKFMTNAPTTGTYKPGEKTRNTMTFEWLIHKKMMQEFVGDPSTVPGLPGWQAPTT